MPKYFVKYVSPKQDKTNWKVLWYTIMVENEKWNYNYSDFFSVEDMKSLYWCNTENDCLNLKGKEAILITSIQIKK